MMTQSTITNDPRLSLKIQTHYYKIAHIHLVSYSIYAAQETVSDARVLELEVEIRAKHPRILITYYNKYLYHFNLSHWDADALEHSFKLEYPQDRLDTEHSELVFKHQKSVLASKLANPVRTSRSSSRSDSQGKDESKNDEFLPFASLSFLKAVKKSLMYNLSLQGEMVIFGNCVVGKINQSKFQHRVTQVDPILLTNGDLIVSLTQRNSLILFHSQILNLEKNFVDFKFDFVVYVIPSGLRCHLYDSTNVLSNFTYTPPKSSEMLARLLELATGIKLSPEDPILWVRLLPNLQHLNNQTSKISRFIHNVLNKKVIIWPWKLCLLQFGCAEKTHRQQQQLELLKLLLPLSKPITSCVDPTALIFDFLQFALMSNEEAKQKASPLNLSNSVGTVNSVTPKPPLTDFGASITMTKLEEQMSSPHQTNIGIDSKKPGLNMPGPELYPSFTEIMSDGANEEDFKKPQSQDVNPANHNKINGKNDGAENDDDDDDDDLFGDASDLEKPSQPILEETSPTTKARANPSGDLDESKSKDKFETSESAQEKISNVQAKALSDITHKNLPFDFASNLSQTPEKSTIIDIPRDEMISQVGDIDGPPSYEDPGAPPPLAPTPILPHTSINLATAEIQKNPFKLQKVAKVAAASQFKNPPASKDDNGDANHRYMFSPIIFNPKIKNKLDTKYGKGGKFYVELESGNTSESETSRILATSADRKSSILKSGDDITFAISRTNDTSVDLQGGGGGSGGTETGYTEDIYEEKSGSGSGADSAGNTLAFKDEDDQMATDHSHWANDEKFAQLVSQEEYIERIDDNSPMEEDDDDEVSDIDEEFPEANDSPLKLNVHGGAEYPKAASTVNAGLSDGSKVLESNALAPRSASVAITSFSIANRKLFLEEGESPQDQTSGVANSVSPNSRLPLKKMDSHEIEEPSVIEIDDVSTQTSPDTNQEKATTIKTEETAADDSETTSCLPLIHRSINVFSIPSNFLIRETPADWDPSSSSSGFAIDVDEEEDDDFQNRDSGLSVNGANIDEYLSSLTPNLSFDCGSFSFNEHLTLNLPNGVIEDVIEAATDGSISEDSHRVISSVFPLNYRIDLAELVRGDQNSSSNSPCDESEETKNQLSFLDDIVDGSLLDSSALKKGPEEIYWDTLLPETTVNQKNFELYCELLEEVSNHTPSDALDEESVFVLNDVKTKVLKQDKVVVNLDFTGTQFWKYLDFCPINGDKKFQVLLITENNVQLNNGRIFESQNPTFLETLRQNFRNNHLGTIKKLHLPTPESRQDLEGINNGLMVLEKQPGHQAYVDYYKKINRRLKDLAEVIKMDLINKWNRFEFDRPLLLLFVSYDRSIHHVSQIAKICRNFQLHLNNHQLSLVEVFSHIIPSEFLVRKVGNQCRMKLLSDLKLSKLSMILYNKCPANSSNLATHTNKSLCLSSLLYTNLVKEPPAALHFKVLNKINREGSTSAFYDDTFLHVAYERSVDKEWILAAWSDPYGVVTYVKSWYCQAKVSEQRNQEAHNLGSIINDIWSISNMLFSKLNEDALQRTFSSGKKKYLVLTRISSIIPDDELVHWKRLTTKDKEIALVVLSTNRLPKILFQAKTSATPAFDGDLNPPDLDTNMVILGASKLEENNHSNDKIADEANTEFIKSFEGSNTSPNGLSFTSPVNANVSQSPSQFMNTPGSFLSPMDSANPSGSGDSEYTVRPPFYDILAILPKVALPSFNSPTRLGMLIGYLIKETFSESEETMQKYMVFEVTLLSCLAYWNLKSLMKTLLNHYKKLIVLNEIIGTCDRDNFGRGAPKEPGYTELRSFVPWHISAVGKTLEYLTHVHVEGGDQ